MFTHLGDVFALAFECSTIEQSNFSSSLQKSSLYEIHKFMALNPDDLGYFIEQVGLAAQSVGLTQAEATKITDAMAEGLTYRCKPLSPLVPGGIVGPQSICTDASCPLAPDYDCTGYDFDNGTSPQPQAVNGPDSASTTTSSTASTSSATLAPTSGPTTTPSSDHTKTVGIAVGVAVPLGLIALALLGFLFFRQRRKMATLENRLSRIEGGTPSQILGSNAVSDVDYPHPAMVSLGFPSNSRAPSQTQEPVVTPQQRTSPDSRPMSWEHFKPAVQTQTIPVENENTQAGIPSARPPGSSIIRPHLSPQEMG